MDKGNRTEGAALFKKSVNFNPTFNKMRRFFSLIFSIASLFCLQKLNAQTINWHSLQKTSHIVTASFGFDYSVSYGIGYGYKLTTKLPIVINTQLSLPSGETPFDDFKIKLGGQMQLFNRSGFVGAISLYSLYRRHETRYVRLQSFGSDMKGTFGYYKAKWFATAEAGFDKAIISHFKHTQDFKDNIFDEVADGWMEPPTGGNFYYGLQTGYSLKKADVTLTLGRVTTQDFRILPTIPFYLNVGLNYRL